MWYVILLAVCIGGDQLLKWWVTSHLDVGQSAPLLPGMEQPPHPMRLGDEHDYYARGPELIRQAPGGGGVGPAADRSEAQEARQEPPVSAPQGADHPAAVRVRTQGQS